jgi:hypothetical protein
MDEKTERMFLDIIKAAVDAIHEAHKRGIDDGHPMTYPMKGTADIVAEFKAEFDRARAEWARHSALNPGDRVQVHSHRGTVRVTDPTWTLVDYDDGEVLPAPTDSCIKVSP